MPTFLDNLAQQAGEALNTPAQPMETLQGQKMNNALTFGNATPSELAAQVNRSVNPMASATPSTLGLNRPATPAFDSLTKQSSPALEMVNKPFISPASVAPSPMGPIPSPPASTVGTPVAPTAPVSAPIATTGAVAPTVDLSRPVSELATLDPKYATTLGEADFAAVSKTAGLFGKINGALSRIPGLSGVNMTGASLMKGFGVATAGLVASGWVDSMNLGGENSNWDRGLSGAVEGLGIGAGGALALGIAGGPVGWAALVGAGLFGLGEAFVWGDDDSHEDKVNKLAIKTTDTINGVIGSTSGIDANVANQIRTQVSATTAIYKATGDLEGMQAYLGSLAQTVPSFLMEAQSRQEATNQKLRLQAAYGPVYAATMERASAGTKQAYDVQMKAAQAVNDPQLSATLSAQASTMMQTQLDTQAAYAQQVAGASTKLTPAEQGVQDQTQALMTQAMSG